MIRLGVITFSIILFGCGGGGGSSGATNNLGPVTISGSVQDGYISGASVFIDTNANYILDAGEKSATTNDRGEFSLFYENGLPSGFLVSVGGTDLDTGIADAELVFVKRVADISNTNLITPLSSIATYLSASSDLNKILGFSSSYEFIHPATNKNSKYYQAANKLSVLAKILRSITNARKGFNNYELDTHIFFETIASRLAQNDLGQAIKIDESVFLEQLLTDLEIKQSVQINNKSDVSIAVSNALSLIQYKSDDLTNKLLKWANETLPDEIVVGTQSSTNASYFDKFKNDIFNLVISSSTFNGLSYDASQLVPSLAVGADTFTINEDTVTTIDILANDDFMSSYPFTFSPDLTPVNGSSSLVNNRIVYTPDANFNGTETFSYSLTQNGQTKTGSVNVIITPVNDAPEIGIALPITVNENQTAIKTLLFSDVDSAAELITTSLSGTDASYFNYTSEGVLSFKEAQDYEFKNSFSITITATDGTSERSYNAIVQLINLNDNSPAIPTDSFAINENTTTVTSSLATDADGGSLNYSLSGTDAAAFSVSSLGVLTFNTAPNYEVKNSYSFDVTASDGINPSVTDSITVNVLDVNDAPSMANLSADINLLPTVSSSASKTIAMNASDDDGDSITYSIVENGSYGSAVISGTDITYTVSASISNSSVAADTIKIRLSDGIDNSPDVPLTINLKTDPFYQYSWHLKNTGQTNFAANTGTAGADMNVDVVINSGKTGNGVTIAIQDSGLEIAHEDIANNHLAGKSCDFLNDDDDPTPTSSGGDHGTSVAGIAAATGWNDKGGRGVAPKANLVGHNVLAYQTISTYLDAYGATPGGCDTDVVDIMNQSYGSGDSSSFDTSGLFSLFLNAYVNGVTNGRSNKGFLYVRSTGNSFYSASGHCSPSGASWSNTPYEYSCYDSSYDDDHTEPYLIGVTALNALDQKSSYSTPGTSAWISGYGGEFGSTYPAMMTTDLMGCDKGYNQSSSVITGDSTCDYMQSFNGTSSAAPSVSGAIALILEANLNLTWRDIKHILASSATQIDNSRSKTYETVDLYKWTTNAAGFKHHPWYGFGKINVQSAITLAEAYVLGSLGTFVNTSGTQTSIGGTITSYQRSIFTTKKITLSAPAGSSNFVEFIKLSLGFDHADPEEISVELKSPDGTTVTVLQPFTLKTSNPSNNDFDMGISSFYGESISGDWTLIITDYTDDGVGGTLDNWSIKVYGH
ncbi:S8 family serine peptidase [SAR86 cluster bacterium]|nr:S8 family serine peptidase [SAR86 cluster bacterium]